MLSFASALPLRTRTGSHSVACRPRRTFQLGALGSSSPARRPRGRAVGPAASAVASPAQADAEAEARPAALARKEEYILRMRSTLRERCVGAAGDRFWGAIQEEAMAAADQEPLLASFLFATVLNHRSLHSALSFHLANKLASDAMPATMLMQLCREAMDAAPGLACAVQRDLLAVMERDPACTRFMDALLYFKGFHALQGYRVAHALWAAGRAPLAYYLQSQISKALQVDIHPAAQIGPGAFIDHATGVVVGETVVLGENVSLLHHVTLGGSGRRHGQRHPKISDGVLIGAGATVLGHVTVGEGAQIGACSLVLTDVPAHATVVGVPAKIVCAGSKLVPALEMKHERCLCEEEAAAANGLAPPPAG